MRNRFYLQQKAARLRAAVAAAVMGVAMTAGAQTTAPLKPVNFTADATYNKVVLNWENPAQTEVLLTEDFEGSKFPATGWSLKTTNTDDPMNTWFQFPTSEMIEGGLDEESIAMFVHGGKKSALVYPDMNAPHADGSSAVQDEWLYLPATPGADYISFYSYIDPKLLEYAEDEEFADHYYVKVSHDGGKTWKIIWDARTGMTSDNCFQNIKLYLGDASQGDPIVAFNATGDLTNPDTGIYFAWAIDDVQLLKGVGDMSVAPTEAYNLYYDGTLLAENLTKTTYTDLSDKEPGNHTYAVEAVSKTANMKSEKAELNVEIKEPTLNAPTNVKLSYTEDTTPGKYNVTIKWDAPKGERKPVNYSVYCNNALVAGFLEEMEVEQTGKPKGAYTYQVVACYEYPSGESDPALAEAEIAIGTRFPASNFQAERSDEGNVEMTWKAPTASEYALKNYVVYRGNTKLGETTETKFTEQNAPQGIYDYAVKAVYTDGVASLPAKQTIEYGLTPRFTLPFAEDFTGGMTPENWKIEKLDGKMQDQYLWRFDNWFDLPITGGNFSGEFASLASSVAGYTRVWATLDTPPLVRGTLNDGEKTYLEFDLDYNASGKTSEAGVYYSYDGESWALIGNERLSGYTTDDIPLGKTCMPEHKVFDVTNCFTDDTTPVYFAWNYKGKVANHLAIDNVKIFNGTSASIRTADSKTAYTVNGNSINVNGASRVQVFSADGIRIADATAKTGEQITAPLAKGMNMVKITTTDGIKTIKLNK